MHLLKNKISIAVLSFALVSNILSAINPAPKMCIDKGGAIFSAPYKLQIPSSDKRGHSELIVEAHLARVSTVTKSHNGPIYPGPYSLGLHFRLNNTDASISTHGVRNGLEIYEATNISASSEWYPGLLKLLARFGSQFDPERCKKEKYRIVGAPKAASFVRIKPLPGCRLQATYSIRRIASFPRRSYLDGRVMVQVDAKEKISKSHRGKKIIILRATFRTTKKITQLSVIKFAKTKKDLIEISRKNIKPSSHWHPWVRKIVEKSAHRYLRYRHKHNKISQR